jgi:hypothetical protein
MIADVTGNGGAYSAESPLGAHASRLQRTGRTIPFGDPRHLQAHQWLVDEAHLLDAQRYADWLGSLGTCCTPTAGSRPRDKHSRPYGDAGAIALRLSATNGPD